MNILIYHWTEGRQLLTSLSPFSMQGNIYLMDLTKYLFTCQNPEMHNKIESNVRAREKIHSNTFKFNTI